MLDILLSRLKEEIAIDGSTGSNIETVWEYVESISKTIAKESGASIVPLVDLKYKAFIWNYLKTEKDLEFYENIALQPIEPVIVPVKAEPAIIDRAVPETDSEVLELIKKAESSSRKRKAPSKPKAKAKPKKKAKSKPKKKKKAKKAVVAGDSDDDFEAGDESDSSSSSESDFDQETDESDESEDMDSEEIVSDEDIPVPASTKAKTVAKSNGTATKSKKSAANITLNQIENISALTYDQMVEKYGDRLFITGSLELQEQQLYVGVPPGSNLSPNLVVILQAILKTRAKGLLQANITKYLDIDSRSTGHYCKSLEEKGAITRDGVSLNKMRTNICIHTRFVASKETLIDIDEDYDVPYNVNAKGKAFSQTMLRDSLIDLVKDAPNNIIMSEDVMRALGFNNSRKAVRKWFNRTINELCVKGYIRNSNVKNGNSTKARRCIQLLKLPTESITTDELPNVDIQYPIRIANTKRNVPILSFLVDSSIESQVLQILLAAGDHGATQKELGFALNSDENRVLYRILEKMCELTDIGLQRFGAVRLLEFEGRQRRYRYFTYASYYRNENGVDLIPPAIPDPDMDESDFREVDPFIDTPHSLKLFQKFVLSQKRGDGADVVTKKLGRPKKSTTGENNQKAKKPPSVKKTKKAGSSSNAPSQVPPTGVSAMETSDCSTHVAAANTETPTTTTITEAQTLPIIAEDPSSTLNNKITEVVNTSKESAPISIDESSNITPSPNVIDIEQENSTQVHKTRRRSLVSVEEIPTKRARIVDENNASASQTAPIVDLTKDSGTSSISNSPPVTNQPSNSASTLSTTSAPKVQKRSIADYFTKKPREQSKGTNSGSASPVPANVPKDKSLSSINPVEPMEIDAIATSKEGNSQENSNIATNTANSIEETINTSTEETSTTNISSNDNITSDTTAVQEPVVSSSTSGINTSQAPAFEAPVTSEGSITESATVQTPIVETPAIKGPRVMKTTFKKGYSHKISQVNIYMEIRMKVLLKMLEDRPMWDISKELMDQYTIKATELFGTPKYSVCSKTLWRSATTLADRGEAIIDTVDCPLLNGQVIKKRILLRNDVDINGKEYRYYKRNLRDRRVFQQPYSHSGKKDVLDVSVETLEGRIDRMKSRMQYLIDNNKIAESKALQVRINELSENAEKFIPFFIDNSAAAWLITGIQFGWVRAKMLRIKLLYNHIFNLWQKEESIEGVDKENRILTMAAIVNKLPLSLYCNIIGLFEPPEPIIEYVKDPANTEATYETMPHHIRSELYSNKNKFRRRLHKLICGLEYLDLITAVTATPEGYEDLNKYGNLTPILRLERKVNVRDMRKLGQPTVREHILDSEPDVALYWSELQYVALQVSNNISKEESEPVSNNAIEAELARGIGNINNWSSASIYTRRQRKVLNSYVNKAEGITPLNNYSICADIADEINTNITYVRRYFAKIEVAIERKKKDSERKKYERRIKPIVSRWTARKRNYDLEGRRVISLRSTKAFRMQQLNTIGTQQNSLYMDDNGDIPVLSGDRLGNALVRKKRVAWTTDDDELLVYSYVILRHRAARSSFRWPAIVQVFPHREPNQCRQRLHRMLTDILYMEQLETASNFWNRFYNEGIQKGDITDPDPREMIEFDLLAYLTYFLKRLNDGESLFLKKALPFNVTYINEHFKVTHGVANPNPYYFEDRYHAASTLITEMSALYHQSLSARRVADHEYDTIYSSIANEDDINKRTIDIIKAYALMILLSPAEVYDPFFSYSVFLSYPPKLFDAAIEEMRAAGVLIQAKLDRPIPGTRFGLGAKAFNIMAGKLPKNMLSQAREYYKYLNEQTSSNRFLPEVVSSGMMACLLKMLSEYKLNISIANRSSKLKQLENITFSSRLTDRSLTILDMDFQKISNEGLITDEDSSKERDLKIINEQELDLQLGNFLKTQHNDIKKPIQLLVDTLKEHESQGLTLYQLKLALDGQIDDATILNIVYLLEKTDPPMLCSVGFGSLRYVLSPYLGTWVIDTSTIITQSTIPQLKEEEEIASVIKELGVNRKAVIQPRFWIDLNGNVTDIVFMEFKEAIIDYILRRPGSTVANIHRNFALVLSRVDLQNILQILVKDNKLRQVQVIQPNNGKARKSIFTKTCSFKSTTKPVIERATQTCYWVSSLNNSWI